MISKTGLTAKEMTGKIQNFTVSGGYNQSMSNAFPEIFVVTSGLPTGSSLISFHYIQT